MSESATGDKPTMRQEQSERISRVRSEREAPVLKIVEAARQMLIMESDRPHALMVRELSGIRRELLKRSPSRESLKDREATLLTLVASAGDGAWSEPLMHVLAALISRRNQQDRKNFKRFGAFVWFAASLVVSVAVAYDFPTAEAQSQFYGFVALFGMLLVASLGVLGITAFGGNEPTAKERMALALSSGQEPQSAPIADEATAEARSAQGNSGDSEEERSLSSFESAVAGLARVDIATGFDRWAGRADRSSKWFLAGAVLAPTVSASTSLWLVLRSTDLSTAEVLARLAVGVPGLVIAALFVAEAAAKRRYARWGSLISIQAEHIGDYVKDLHPDDQREIQRRFALAVFAGGDVLPDGDSAVHRAGKRKAPDSLDPVAFATQIVGLVTGAAAADKAQAEASTALVDEDRVKAEATSALLHNERIAAEVEALKLRNAKLELELASAQETRKDL